jgi:putative flippase GtrA
MARAELLGELARFTAVGALGFVVDSSVLYAGLWAGLGLYAGRVLSYIAAASFTWFLNRRFTFRSLEPVSVGEWLRFLAVNAVGGIANLGVYAALVARLATCAAHPVLAVAAGSLAGLLINFGLSRYAVFRRT